MQRSWDGSMACGWRTEEASVAGTRWSQEREGRENPEGDEAGSDRTAVSKLECAHQPPGNVLKCRF